MKGSTHIAIGVASSLVILQPKTIPECLCTLTGGMIGGMICDIDSPGKRKSLDLSDDPYGWQIYSFIGITVVTLLGLDYFSGDGAVDYIMHHLDITFLVGIIAFLGLCFYGSKQIHRTFMHSIVAGILFTLSIYAICKPICYSFVIGYVSHLFLDLFNQRKMMLFWPLKIRVGLNKFPSNGKLNDFLFGIGTVVSIFLFAYYFINGFVDSSLYRNIINLFSKLVSISGKISVPFIVPYLFGINILGFIVYFMDYIFWKKSKGFYATDNEDMIGYIMTLYLIIDFLGGVLGKLLVVLITQKGKIYKADALANFDLYTIPICILISWITMLFTFFIPSVSEDTRLIEFINANGIVLFWIIIGYFLLINIISMLVFPNMNTFTYQITMREKVCLFLSFIGGAAGGYLSMHITGKHQKAVMLSNTLPEMMVMHAIVLSCLLYMI